MQQSTAPNSDKYQVAVLTTGMCLCCRCVFLYVRMYVCTYVCVYVYMCIGRTGKCASEYTKAEIGSQLNTYYPDAQTKNQARREPNVIMSKEDSTYEDSYAYHKIAYQLNQPFYSEDGRTTQLEFQVTCYKPGDGKSCHIVIGQLKMCSGPFCHCDYRDKITVVNGRHLRGATAGKNYFHSLPGCRCC